MNPTRRLQLAEALLTGSGPDIAGAWARATAWSIRLAIEQALRQLWDETVPELSGCSMRAQLLALPKFVEDTVAADVSELWHTLSRAAHHHDYELAPTAVELRAWHSTASRLTDELRSERGAT